MYFVIEFQTRADGIVNTSTTSRSNLANALSLYHERYSKMVVNTEFPSVSIMLVDKDLNVIRHDTIETQYQGGAE